MATRCTTNSRQSTRRLTDCGHIDGRAGDLRAERNTGLTIVELLVALMIGILILGIAFSMVMSNRRLYQADQNRTEANQNLRVSLDMIGADARIAGELMTDPALKLMAIEVIGGSELILRRKIVGGTLPVCLKAGQTLGAGTTIPISKPAADTDELAEYCNWIDSENNNGMPDYVEPYFEALAASDGNVRAYIYQGGTFEALTVIDIEPHGSPMGGRTLTVTAPVQHNFVFSGPPADPPAIVFVSERHYRVNDGVLELVIDGKGGDSALKIANRVEDMEVSVVVRDGNVFSQFGAGSGLGWQEVREIQVSMTSGGSGQGSGSTRTLASSFFPRNVLSRGDAGGAQ